MTDPIDLERLACAIAIVGPVDMDDTNAAARAYGEDVAREYSGVTEVDLAHFAGNHALGASLAEAARRRRE